MLRRKLFLYTLFYAAGITAGFFVFERSRVSEAAGLLVSIALVVIITDPDETAAHPDSQGDTVKQKFILVSLIIIGFFMMSLRVIAYDKSVRVISQTDAVTGIVKSVEVKEDRIDFVIKPVSKHLSKIVVTSEPDNIDFSAINSSTRKRSDEVTDIPDGYPYILTGSLISARGEYKELNSADNPGCFDYRVYMRSKGVPAGFRAYSVTVSEPGKGITAKIKIYLYKTRESFIGRFNQETGGFIRGVIFGDKSEIDDEMLKEFNYNSTGHILAVSGLHVGFLYGLLRTLTGRRKSRTVSALVITVILLYGEMTMWSPATVRACIVLTVSLLSVHLKKRPDLLTSVSAAALMILIYEPYQLFNSGFQMSFLALLGIAFLTKPVSMLTGESLGVMLAVQIGTMPVTAYTFGRFAPLSMLINVPVILLASLLVPLCILLLIIETVFGSNLMLGIHIAELISLTVIKINHLLSFNGEFTFVIAGWGTMAIMLFYFLTYALSSEWMKIQILRKNRKAIIRTGAVLLMPVIILSSCLYDRFSDDEIVFVAVGQGDCTHIRAGDIDVLIDGGGVADYKKDENDRHDGSFNTGEKILMPYLLHEGVKNVDAALVTHLHTDHYKGIAELSEIYPVGSIGIPVDYRGSLSKIKVLESGNTGGTSKCEPFYVKPDTKVKLSDEVYIEVLWPLEVSRDPLSADDPNEHNTVYMINYKEVKIMVTGDLLEEDELEMVKHYKGTDKLKCHILKVAHHGSKSSSCEEFLDAASPEIAVIQVGRNNFYGHPHKQTLDRLNDRGIRIFRTDQNGAVGIDIRKRSLRLDLYHD